MHVERAPASSRLTRSAFEIPRMDCAAEERLVRIALDGAGEVRSPELPRPLLRHRAP